MTLRTLIEQRKAGGRVLSKQNVAHVKAVLTSAKTLLANAGEQDDTLPLVGGDDGTIGNPDMAAGQVSAPDGTGQRGRPAGPTIRTVHGQTYEVR